MRTPAGMGTARYWLTRRLWLPKGLYAAIPWVYCLLGAASLASGLFMPQPGWIIPYLFLSAVCCVDAGIWLLTLRRRRRLQLLRGEQHSARIQHHTG